MNYVMLYYRAKSRLNELATANHVTMSAKH